VLIACWSTKGGSGTTVVAAALALLLARAHGSTLLADLGGDAPAALGLPEPPGPGMAEWLATTGDVGSDALARLEVEAAPDLHLLPRGTGPLPPGPRARSLAAALAVGSRPVVVDAGRAQGAAAEIVAGATSSLLVVRPCYLALRRAVAAPVRPSGIVLVAEAGRSLTRRDIEDVIGAPVRAEITLDPAVARAVDAGLLAGRLPRSLERGLRNAA
jgi:hypothetical protein